MSLPWNQVSGGRNPLRTRALARRQCFFPKQPPAWRAEIATSLLPSAPFTTFYNPLRPLDTLALEGLYSSLDRTRGFRMSKKWRLTDRTRTLLTLELAMVLPAAALMAFSIYNLKHIQHSEAIEAVLQRELNNVLRYAQKKSWERAYNMVLPIRQEFPVPDDGSQIKAKLGRVLSDHPEFSYAALYDKKNDMLVTRMQPGRDDAVICGYTQEQMDMLAKWLPLDASHMVSEVRKMEDNENELVMFYGDWSQKQHTYWNVAYFIPPGVPKDREVLGLVAFDSDYLRKTFLPAMMKDVLISKSGLKANDANPPVIMIHPSMDETPWVTSGNWDGSKPEAERPFQWFLQQLTIAIKYQGITVAQIGNRILRYNYIILGALSVLMIGGIWLTNPNFPARRKWLGL